MYNGIGLATARGSGTNGYVVRNLSSLRPQRREPDRSFDDMKSRGPAIKQPNQEILLHDRKRQIEVECLKLRLILEDDEVNEDDIEVRVQALRDSLNAKLDTVQPKSAKSLHSHETHQLSEAKQHENKKMMRALGINEGEYIEGAAFDKELQAKLKQERIAKREAEYAEREAEREARKQKRSISPRPSRKSKRSRTSPQQRRSRSPETKLPRMPETRRSQSVESIKDTRRSETTSRGREPEKRKVSRSPVGRRDSGVERGRRLSVDRSRRRSYSSDSRSSYSSYSRSRSRSRSSSRGRSTGRGRGRSMSRSRSRSMSRSRSRSYSRSYSRGSSRDSRRRGRGRSGSRSPRYRR